MLGALDSLASLRASMASNLVLYSVWLSSRSGTAVSVKLTVSDSSPESKYTEYVITKSKATVMTEANTILFFSIFIVHFFKGFFEVIGNQQAVGIFGKVPVNGNEVSGGDQFITVHDRASIYLK